MVLTYPRPRVFEFWYYTIGHSTLLIRSLREDNPWSHDRVIVQTKVHGRIRLPVRFSANRLFYGAAGKCPFQQAVDADPDVKVLVFMMGNHAVGQLEAEFMWQAIDQGCTYDPCTLSLPNHMQRVDAELAERHQGE